jgi:type I restriction enzyme S subunit
LLVGEFLINPINLNYDLKSLRTGLSDINTCVSPAYIVLRAKAESNKNYLKYQLYLFDVSHMKTLGAGVRQTITFGDIGTCFTCLPPLSEQTAIAEFLDRETGKIDELVAEQRRLMELLKEKRHTVISHAVTKGLNPRAPIKPSGIEWLGDVPRHWEVWKLTHSFKTIGSGTTPKTDNRDYYENGAIPWVNTGDLNDSFLADCENKITGSARKENPTLKMYPAGSVVIAMYGATIGKLAILKFPACVNQACCVFADREKIDYKFLFYWLLAYRSQIISLASGGGQPNISQDILRRLRVGCPTLEEQNAIVAYVDRETLNYDSLTAESLRTIDLLLERRSALISAAVTGQIDVRKQTRN